MKKIMIISLVVIAFVAMAAPVFAEKTCNGKMPSAAAVTTVIAGATFAPSTGVWVSATSTAQDYTVTAVHNSSLLQASGKVYGATSKDSTISYIVAPAAYTTYTTNSATVLNPTSGWLQ